MVSGEDTLISWESQKSIYLGNKYMLITWNQAKAMIMENKSITGKVYTAGWFSLYLEDNDYLCFLPSLESMVEWNTAVIEEQSYLNSSCGCCTPVF